MDEKTIKLIDNVTGTAQMTLAELGQILDRLSAAYGKDTGFPEEEAQSIASAAYVGALRRYADIMAASMPEELKPFERAAQEHMNELFNQSVPQDLLKRIIGVDENSS